MLKKFKTDPKYLCAYHFKSAALLFLVNSGLVYYFKPPIEDILWYLPGLILFSSTQLRKVIAAFVYVLAITAFRKTFTLYDFGWMTFAILISLPFTALIHCASHNSIRPRWLNRPVGELMGLVQLTGFPDWTIIHFIHHTHTDDPALDPHPPLHMKFWPFATHMRQLVLNSYVNYYMSQHGDNPQTMCSIKNFGYASKLDHWMKIAFWFLVLRPHFFSVVFVTSIVFKMIHFAWLNYSTHRPTSKGTEIKNYNYGWYKVANTFAFGLYFHKNHHQAPHLFDPRHLKELDENKTAA